MYGMNLPFIWNKYTIIVSYSVLKYKYSMEGIPERIQEVWNK